MLTRRASRALIAGAAFLSLTAGSGPASADILLDSMYVPTSSVVTLPSSAYIPTTYVVPTAYSTTYLPTSEIVGTGDVVIPTTATYYPTAYYAPAYRRVRYRPRRYVERTTYLASPTYPLAATSYLSSTSYVVPTRYLSTSYVAPTSYLTDTALVATSASMCCDSETVAAPTRTMTTQPASPSGNSGGGMITSSPSNAIGQSAERTPSATLNSTPSGDEVIRSDVVPAVPAPASAKPAGPELKTPPEPKPVEGPDPNSLIPPKAGEPGSSLPPPPPKIDEQTYRSSQRPVYGAGSDLRNILRGKVVSFDSGRPEESVTVVLSSKTGTFADRTAMTNADGEFKVSLPQGDWVVKVKMPSGSILPVGRDYLTASSGKVTDLAGRSVKEFRISR